MQLIAHALRRCCRHTRPPRAPAPRLPACSDGRAPGPLLHVPTPAALLSAPAPCRSEDDEPFESYVRRMSKDGAWAGHLEVQAASLLLQRNISVYQAGQPVWHIRNFPDVRLGRVRQCRATVVWLCVVSWRRRFESWRAAGRRLAGGLCTSQRHAAGSVLVVASQAPPLPARDQQRISQGGMARTNPCVHTGLPDRPFLTARLPAFAV